MYRCTFGGRVYTGRNPQKTWWALRVTIPRPSRCKQEAPAQICGFYGQTHKDLRNIGPFCSRFVAFSGTFVHIGRQREWYSRAALTIRLSGVQRL